MLGQIGSALHAAHQLGIIHRDVKPENLFLHRRADGVIVAKVLDFGISKFSADAGIGLTTTGAFVGTPLYMAPEQAHSDNDKITPATDIWALGLVTLRLLTGEHLWGSPSMTELVTKIVVSPIPKPSERWPDSAVMSPELDAWFARSCDRDPTKRWSSVDDQMRSLKDALDVVPIAVADTRPSGSLAVNTTTTSERSPARSRRPLQALGIGVLVFAAVAIWLRVCGGPSELSGPVVAAWEAAAVEDSSILLLNDLPASFTTSDSARTKFRVAMRTYGGEGKMHRAKQLLDEAIKEDPSFASAQLERAYLSSTRAVGLDTPGREAFRAATEQRDALSARDREFLDALSPSFLDPPRYRDTADRFEAFIAAHRGDVQAREALGFATINFGDAARAERAFRAALGLQPGAPVAAKLLAQLLVDHAGTAEAIEVLKACIARTSSATACRQQLIATFASIGRCADADSAARDAVVVDPTDPSVASLRAGTAAATGAPADVLTTLLARRRTLAGLDDRAALESEDAFSMSMREGDFLNALVGIDRAETDANQAYSAHHQRAFRRSFILWEMGEARKSADAALAFLRRAQMRSLPERIEGDETGRLLNFAYAGGAIGNGDFGVRRRSWVSHWRNRETDIEWSNDEGVRVWIRAYATPAVPTSAESRIAFDARDEDGGIELASNPDPAMEVALVADYGALLLGADRLDEAEAQLTSAARACVLVPDVRALYLLGNVYAKKNQKDKACGVYAEVEALWGHAKPRSITAEAARAEAKKLGCR